MKWPIQVWVYQLLEGIDGLHSLAEDHDHDQGELRKIKISGQSNNQGILANVCISVRDTCNDCSTCQWHYHHLIITIIECFTWFEAASSSSGPQWPLVENNDKNDHADDDDEDTCDDEDYGCSVEG